jgi:DNA-binding transcriptional ArsR family regulator
MITDPSMMGTRAPETPVANSTRSHHFKILGEAGIINTRRKGGQSLNVRCAAEVEASLPGLLRAILPPSSAIARHCDTPRPSARSSVTRKRILNLAGVTNVPTSRQLEADR